MPSTGYEVIYPSNCKEISEDLSLSTLRHRLKDLWSNLHRLSENLFKIDETQCERDFQFKGLALHLSGEQFTQHEDKDTRILVACCLNEIAKCYFPDSLYPDNAEANSLLENMFLICINSLSHLTSIKTTDEVSHSRLMSLLENFLKVDFFELLQDMDCAPQVFLKYVQLLFSIMGNVQKWAWLSVQSHIDNIVENISRIINNYGSVWNEDAIRFLCRYISERHSTESAVLYNISKDIFVRTCDHVDQCVHTILTQALAIADESEKIYTLIFELHRINHALVAPVLPLLDIKLKSASVSDRKRACRLLGRLFSEPLTNLVNQQSQLWSAFLGRFNDIDKDVRNICVRSIPMVLRNSPDLRDQLVVTLAQRSLDPDESIRSFVLEVCATLQVEQLTHRKELYADLLKIILDRVRDRNEAVRSKAATKAAKLYHNVISCLPADEDLWQKGKDILNGIMHLYYFTGIRDRVLVENLFKTQFVPYQLMAHDRMRALLRAFCSFDEQSERCFAEMLKCQFSVTLLVEKIVLFLDSIHGKVVSDTDEVKLMDLIHRLAASLDKGQNERIVDHLRRFFFHISKNTTLYKLMRQLVSAECTCANAYDILTKIVKMHCVGGGGAEEGSKDKSGLAKYNHTIRTLLQRAGPVIFDAESITSLVNLLVISRDDPHCVLPGEQVNVSLHNGLRLLKELATYRRSTFDSDDAFEYLSDAIKNEDDTLSVLGLRVLLLVVEMLRHRREQSLCIIEHLSKLALNGTAKQAKLSVLCMMQLRLNDEDANIRSKLDDIMEQCLQESDTLPRFSLLIVAGHVAQVMNNVYGKRVKDYVIRYLLPRIMLANPNSPPLTSSKVRTPVESPTKRRAALLVAQNALSKPMRKSLASPSANEHRPKLSLWTESKDLSAITRLKMVAMKMMVRWLLGMQATELDYSKPVIRVLHETMIHMGDITQCRSIAEGEMAQLRLQAAKCWIKIASCKRYVRSVSMQQFESMAFIMADPCPQVREAFLQRLHRALIGLHLPLEYLAIYAITPEVSLSVDAAQFHEKVAKSLNTNVQHRRQLLASKKELSSDPRKLYALLPDLMLPYVVHLLASDANFVDENDTVACQRRKDCLWFVMEPLVVKGENYSFLRKLIYRMKACEDALNKDAKATHKLHVICDLAYGILATKSPKFQLKEYPFEPPLPMRLFKNSDQLPSPAYSDLPSGVLFSPPKNHRAVEDGCIPAERLRSKTAASKVVKKAPLRSLNTHTLEKNDTSKANVDIDEADTSSESDNESAATTSKKQSVNRKRTLKDGLALKASKRIRHAIDGADRSSSVISTKPVKNGAKKKKLSPLKRTKKL